MSRKLEGDARLSRLGPLSAWVEGVAILALVATLGIIANTHVERAQAAARYADTLTDLRYQLRAVEAYAVDNTNYPFMSWGDYNGLKLGMSDSYAGNLTFGTLTNHMTTPIAYMNALMEDYAGSIGAGRPELYSYHSARAHLSLWNNGAIVPVPGSPGSVYTPMNSKAVKRLELYFGAFAVWSSGPNGNLDFENFAYWLPYDPTNGIFSEGNISIGPRAQSPLSFRPI